MNPRIDALIGCLDALPAPLTMFFRDDDAGAVDERLYRLLDLFAMYRAPLDLAVIPDALERATARMLLARHDEAPALLGLHQHGLRHVNHEPQARKCEFGDARSAAQQHADIAAGQARLQQTLGDALDPIFTPPWNRCSQATVAALQACGFAALSRNVGAAPLQTNGLRTPDVTLDWCRTSRPDFDALTRGLSACAGADQAFGVMLHHAVMHAESFDTLEQVLEAITRHPRVRLVAMRTLLSAGSSARIGATAQIATAVPAP